MSSTQPPYHTATFGEPNQNPSATTPIGTELGGTGTGAGDSQAEQVPSTTEHKSNFVNKVDPSVDSDVHSRAYTGGTSGNVPSGRDSYGSGYNAGPHESSTLNKADPRVDSSSQGHTGLGTSSDTAQTAQGTSSGGYNAGPHASSALNKADPRVDSSSHGQTSGLGTSSGYAQPHTAQDVTSGGYNAGPHESSTLNKAGPRVDSGTGQTTNTFSHQTGLGASQGTAPSGSSAPHDSSGGFGSSHATDASGSAVPQAATAGGLGAGAGAGAGAQGAHGTQSQYKPSTENTASTGVPTSTDHSTKPDYKDSYTSTTTEANANQPKSAKKGEDIGRSLKSAAAGIHGAGESLRGGLTTAIDKAFGHEEGAAKNSAIAREGEREIQSGNFGRSQR